MRKKDKEIYEETDMIVLSEEEEGSKETTDVRKKKKKLPNWVIVPVIGGIVVVAVIASQFTSKEKKTGGTVEVAANNVVTVTGPKGTLVKELPVEMEIKVEGEEVVVTRPSDLKKMKSLHGLTRTLINNMVVGVTNGYEKVLEVNGVGYRASKSGNKLTLNLGYSHPVEMIDPEGVETVLEGQNKITVKGIDKEKVGQFAAEIRDKRRPEPYKGKGIKYADEVIRRKVGKTGKK